MKLCIVDVVGLISFILMSCFQNFSCSCVPLYNFSYTYDYVISSSKSFVDSFLDPKGNWYNPKMAPTIQKDKWRKITQWVTLIRKHVEVMVADNKIFPVLF